MRGKEGRREMEREKTNEEREERKRERDVEIKVKEGAERRGDKSMSDAH